MYTHRMAKEGDYKNIMDLIKTNMLEMQLEIGIEWNDENINKFFRSKTIFVFEKYSEFIGFYAIDGKENRVFIYSFQLVSKFQNLMSGYHLFKVLINDAIKNDKEIILCRVFNNNPAKDIYIRLGFKVVEEKDNVFALKLNLYNDLPVKIFNRLSESTHNNKLHRKNLHYATVSQ